MIEFDVYKECKKRDKVVEALPYSIGLEDGFHSMQESKLRGLNLRTYSIPDLCEYIGVPYILMGNKYEYIHAGDYIINDPTIGKSIVDKGYFEQMFERIS